MSAQEQHHPPGLPTAGAASGETPLYRNLGALHHTITTQSERAQQYFNQGLRLTYAFNHDEAIKSFKQGLVYDSTCAMCYWGIAYALGPNINLPMDSSLVGPAWDAAYSAVRLSVTCARASSGLSAAAGRLQVSALRHELPASRRNQNLAGRMGSLRPPALLLFPAFLDWPPDETGDAHLPNVPRDLIR